MFNAESAEQNAEISKKMNEDYKDGIRQMHRELLEEVCVLLFLLLFFSRCFDFMVRELIHK